jgi:Gas vesicle protein K
MKPIEEPMEELGVESEAVSNFARSMQTGLRARINLEPDQVKNGLGQLVLTLVKLLHELLERQALRRIEGGTLAPDEIERIGVTLMRQTAEIKRLQREFGLTDEDLNLDLGPLGTLL